VPVAVRHYPGAGAIANSTDSECRHRRVLIRRAGAHPLGVPNRRSWLEFCG
jgi:hypothetical protein